MRKAITVLMPNTAGAGRRVVNAVQAAAGKVERSKIKLLARETSVKELIVSCDGERGIVSVIRSLEALDGLSVVGVENVDTPERS
jgi:hypothetical protein